MLVSVCVAHASPVAAFAEFRRSGVPDFCGVWFVCETCNRLPEPDPENCCTALSSSLSSSSSSAATDQSDDDDAFDRFGPLHAPICGTAYLINLHTAAPCLVGGGPSGSRSARARSRAHLSSPRPVLLSESKAPRKLCAWPRSMDFPTARPIVVEERSRAISRWVMMRHALDGKRSWIVTQLVILTDSPTASNIDCLSPPAEELQLDAVRVLLAVLAKSLQGAAVLCHARSYWKRKLRAAVRASAVPPGVSQISRG